MLRKIHIFVNPWVGRGVFTRCLSTMPCHWFALNSFDSLVVWTNRPIFSFFFFWRHFVSKMLSLKFEAPNKPLECRLLLCRISKTQKNLISNPIWRRSIETILSSASPDCGSSRWHAHYEQLKRRYSTANDISLRIQFNLDIAFCWRFEWERHIENNSPYLYTDLDCVQFIVLLFTMTESRVYLVQSGNDNEVNDDDERRRLLISTFDEFILHSVGKWYECVYVSCAHYKKHFNRCFGECIVYAETERDRETNGIGLFRKRESTQFGTCKVCAVQTSIGILIITHNHSVSSIWTENKMKIWTSTAWWRITFAFFWVNFWLIFQV